VGVTALLIAYLLMMGSGLRVAIRSQRSFSKLLATGLSLLLGVQVFVVVGGITRMIPITGITLPFVSYGGSSLVSNYILLAILLRISNDNAIDQALAEAGLGQAATVAVAGDGQGLAGRPTEAVVL
jgi:peptidoglycan glycosyltransferase